MKRTILTAIAAVFAVSASWAQNPFETVFSECKVMNTTSEQGHDRIDSLFYLHTQTYSLPFKSRKEMGRADRIVRDIVERYRQLLPSHTDGFCYSSDLHDTLETESKMVNAYYGENLPPLAIGGKCRNYAVLQRLDAANPSYRTAYGVEWWKEQGQRVCFKVFCLFGPMTDPYHKAMFQDNSTFTLPVDSMNGQVPASGILRDFLKDNTEFTVQSLRALCRMYKGEGNVIDEATAEIAAKKFANYMSASHSREEQARVMRELRIPGFYAEVSNGKDVRHGTLPWLAEEWTNLNVFCITWEQKGAPACSKYGEKSKYFLLQVMLQ